MNQLFKQMTSNYKRQMISNATRGMFNQMYRNNPQLYDQLIQMKQSGMTNEDILRQNGISVEQFNAFKNNLR